MSQVGLGRLLGRKAEGQNAYKIENGQSGLSVPDLCKIAEHFDISLDWLIRGAGEPSGLDPVLTPADINTILNQFGATEAERRAFAQHSRIYTSSRVTSAYLVAFLLGHRSHGSVDKAADEAQLAAAKNAARAETGNTERAAADALRKRRPSKRK